MRCPACGHEFKSPVAQAGGRAGGAAKVAKGFAISGQPDAAARRRAWKTRKARARRSPNNSADDAETEGAMREKGRAGAFRVLLRRDGRARRRECDRRRQAARGLRALPGDGGAAEGS